LLKVQKKQRVRPREKQQRSNMEGIRLNIELDGDGNYRMSVIRFPTHLVSTLGVSEAINWPHSELMKDACATAEDPEIPADWFRMVHYRDENGSAQTAYNMTCSGLKMLLWNCSGPPDLRRRCLHAMGAIVARVG
jgi:hypothetical protein